MKFPLITSFAIAVAFVLPALAEDAAPIKPVITVDPDGTVNFPPITVPFSIFASDEARQKYIAQMALPPVLPNSDIVKFRASTETALTPLLNRASELYPVKIASEMIGGVYTDVVTPKDGVPVKNRDKVLINLHGGGFVVGARISGKVEAVPIAGLGGYKVIAVDYREGPEDRFPAASIDVATVYKELLKTYKSKNIGIYGCSAGGVLTAEAVAWFQKEKLPAPGAIGIFCASASGWAGGDSSYFTAPYGRMMPRADTPHFPVYNASYLDGVDMKDPLVAPVWSPLVLAKFPPTLVITGTRDIAMSSAIYTHSQLVKQGVYAELHIWDGVGHGFFLDPNLPESKEAFSVIVSFFDHHLGN